MTKETLILFIIDSVIFLIISSYWQSQFHSSEALLFAPLYFRGLVLMPLFANIPLMVLKRISTQYDTISVSRVTQGITLGIVFTYIFIASICIRGGIGSFFTISSEHISVHLPYREFDKTYAWQDVRSVVMHCSTWSSPVQINAIYLNFGDGFRLNILDTRKTDRAYLSNLVAGKAADLRAIDQGVNCSKEIRNLFIKMTLG